MAVGEPAAGSPPKKRFVCKVAFHSGGARRALGNVKAQNTIVHNFLLEFLVGDSMPTFQCTRCGKMRRCEYEVSTTGDVKRNVEKAPVCCGKPMIETID